MSFQFLLYWFLLYSSLGLEFGLGKFGMY
uniref:Nucleoside (Except guanosine) transporter n=1 Tax=mine drainage metagenome TaxID=410659 RepID=E6Q8W5_9ZZZZ